MKYAQMNFLVSLVWLAFCKYVTINLQFFACHVHILKDKDMQILLCIP